MAKNKKAAKLYIRVNFSEKDEAKKLGARWDPEAKSWYVPHEADPSNFFRWLNTNGNAGIGGLYVDLVPKTAWFSNLRSALPQSEWDLRKKVYANVSYRCDVCSGIGPDHPVEAHERWKFDTETNEQTLMSIQALCPACHEATHTGLANVRGFGDRAMQRLMYINDWTEGEAQDHVDKAFERWAELNMVEKWKLNTNWLLNYVELSEETKTKIDGSKR
jgi:hypothetical protein